MLKNNETALHGNPLMFWQHLATAVLSKSMSGAAFRTRLQILRCQAWLPRHLNDFRQ